MGRWPSKAGRCGLAWLFLAAAAALHAADEPLPPGLESVPLAAASGPRGATLFTVTDPARTGVVAENKYDDPEMWGRRAREFDLGGIGTGVAVGDYDNDGRPDLFVVSKTESARLFRNLGDWTFADVTETAGVGQTGAEAKIWKQGACFADVNNDGWLDLYLCRFNATNLLFLNQGDGTFKEEGQARGLDVRDATVMATFGDYDRDGWLDVFVQTNVRDAVAGPEGERDYLFRNRGDGTFENVTDRAGVAPARTHGNSALWWDYDRDGWADLYVANDFSVPDGLFRNRGDGTFVDVIGDVMPWVPYSSMGSDLGDADGDGRLDLFVADMAASTHEKDQRTMAETRARLRPPEENPKEVRQFPLNTLHVDTATGRFLEAGRMAGIAATDWTWSPRWEDFDGDGWVDLHVTNGMYREIHNQDLINRRMGAAGAAAAGQVVRNSPPLAERNFAFRNRGDLAFEDVSAAWGLAQEGISFGSATGDLDGDGDLDLIYVNYQAGPTLLRNDSDGGQRMVVALRGTRSNRFGIGAEVTIETAAETQVRTLTAGRGFMASSEPIAHFGLGEETGVRRLTVRWPSGSVQVFDGLAAGSRYRVTEPAAGGPPAVQGAPAHPGPQFVEVSGEVGLAVTVEEEPYDEFLDQRLLPSRLNSRGPALALADLSGGGQDALMVGGTTRTPPRVLEQGVSSAGGTAGASGQGLPPEGGTTYSERKRSARPPEVNDGPVLAFDATGDGHLDLLVTGGGASAPADGPEYEARLWVNDGEGNLAPAGEGQLPLLSISAGAACAADFDRDGALDVFIGGRVSPGQYPTAPQSALLARRGGRFEDVTGAIAPELRRIGMVTGALWSDVDADGWLDLLITLEWGQVRYFHNEEGRAFADWTERGGFAAGGTGWWRGIVAADFNGDGRMDYAVGNVGLNTGYRADHEHPALLWAGDLGGKGGADLIEAYHDGDRVVPRRSRSEIAAALPSLLRRYRGSNEYARATVTDLLGAEKLAAATRLAATELRGGVFLSQGQGPHAFRPWPRRAQIAPAFGLAAGDFDGDGRADLFLVHNSHAPAPSIGRHDGGLGQLLRGDGRGGFACVAPVESGLVVAGDAKALVAADLDGNGWTDFVVSRAGGSLLVFRNRGVPGRHSVRVSLQGAGANPTAVGARVKAEYTDGTTAAAEVYAGSGYYSQSTAAVFFGSTAERRLRRLSVRWPSGRESTQDVAEPLPAVIRVAEPAN